jgi:UDP-glucose 4-epimerase
VVRGIRPGEKMHEIMISDEEAPRVRARGAYYAIKPMLPELNIEDGETSPLAKEFSSDDSVLDLPGTIALLAEHKLMIDDVSLSETGELLR